MAENAQEPTWPNEIYSLLKAGGLTLVSYVPDGGHKRLIQLCTADPDITTVSLTSEQEGIGLAAGAYLGGVRSALLMQSSGVGNCINALTLVRNCQFPFLTLVTMRGDFGETNNWQMAMGQATEPVLTRCGVVCLPVASPADVEETGERRPAHGFRRLSGRRDPPLPAPDRRQNLQVSAPMSVEFFATTWTAAQR